MLSGRKQFCRMKHYIIFISNIQNMYMAHVYDQYLKNRLEGYPPNSRHSGKGSGMKHG